MKKSNTKSELIAQLRSTNPGAAPNGPHPLAAHPLAVHPLAPQPLRGRPPTADWQRELCLLAPRQLDDTLDWSQGAQWESAPGANARPAQRWRAAQALYADLAVTQADVADGAVVLPLAGLLARHAARLATTPVFQRSFDTVPVAFGLVDLERLVVSQFTLTLDKVEQITAGLAPARGARVAHAAQAAQVPQSQGGARPPPAVSARQLAALCLPLKAPDAALKLVYRSKGELVFMAPAHDTRYLGAQLIAPAPAPASAAVWPGHAQAVLALGLGPSCNVVEVIRWGSRLVLQNGHHRAHALRSLGLSHMPCVIQVCSSWDEVERVAHEAILEHSDLYFELPRPPLLRDFDNPRLTQPVRTPRLQRQLRLSFQVESRLVAA